MAQKAITIYTPSTADPHIYAEDDAMIWRSIFGATSGIAGGCDGQLALSIVDNNTVRLQSGIFSNQGYIVKVTPGTTEDLAVVSGTQNMYRRDLVVAQFTRGGGTTADEHIFTVIAGTAAATDAGALRPTLTQNDLRTGGQLRQEALYEVYIVGTTIQSVTRIAPYVGSYYQ